MSKILTRPPADCSWYYNFSVLQRHTDDERKGMSRAHVTGQGRCIVGHKNKIKKREGLRTNCGTLRPLARTSDSFPRLKLIPSSPRFDRPFCLSTRIFCGTHPPITFHLILTITLTINSQFSTLNRGNVLPGE